MNLEQELGQFTGTEQYYRHLFGKFTDGVKYMADKAGAYWLIDAVMSYQISRKTKGVPFQVWTLKKNEGKNSAVLEMKEDIDAPVLVSQRIPFTDFPLESIKLYMQNGVLMLPSEY